MREVATEWWSGAMQRHRIDEKGDDLRRKRVDRRRNGEEKSGYDAQRHSIERKGDGKE